MSPHETAWFDDCPLKFKHVHYQRYVDATLQPVKIGVEMLGCRDATLHLLQF